MKRLLSVICVVVLLTSTPAMAEIDLSGMSFGELVELRDQIDYAIWNSQEWQEVFVPQGVYCIGDEIPAGYWTISAADGAIVSIAVGVRLNETKTEVEGPIDRYSIESAKRSTYEEGEDIDSISCQLTDGQYIEIEHGNVVFTPYAGKASFVFK